MKIYIEIISEESYSARLNPQTSVLEISPTDSQSQTIATTVHADSSYNRSYVNCPEDCAGAGCGGSGGNQSCFGSPEPDDITYPTPIPCQILDDPCSDCGNYPQSGCGCNGCECIHTTSPSDDYDIEWETSPYWIGLDQCSGGCYWCAVSCCTGDVIGCWLADCESSYAVGMVSGDDGCYQIFPSVMLAAGGYWSPGQPALPLIDEPTYNIGSGFSAFGCNPSADACDCESPKSIKISNCLMANEDNCDPCLQTDFDPSLNPPNFGDGYYLYNPNVAGTSEIPRTYNLSWNQDGEDYSACFSLNEEPGNVVFNAITKKLLDDETGEELQEQPTYIHDDENVTLSAFYDNCYDCLQYVVSEKLQCYSVICGKYTPNNPPDSPGVGEYYWSNFGWKDGSDPNAFDVFTYDENGVPVPPAFSVPCSACKDPDSVPYTLAYVLYRYCNNSSAIYADTVVMFPHVATGECVDCGCPHRDCSDELFGEGYCGEFVFGRVGYIPIDTTNLSDTDYQIFKDGLTVAAMNNAWYNSNLSSDSNVVDYFANGVSIYSELYGSQTSGQDLVLNGQSVILKDVSCLYSDCVTNGDQFNASSCASKLGFVPLDDVSFINSLSLVYSQTSEVDVLLSEMDIFKLTDPCLQSAFANSIGDVDFSVDYLLGLHTNSEGQMAWFQLQNDGNGSFTGYPISGEYQDESSWSNYKSGFFKGGKCNSDLVLGALIICRCSNPETMFQCFGEEEGSNPLPPILNTKRMWGCSICPTCKQTDPCGCCAYQGDMVGENTQNISTSNCGSTGCEGCCEGCWGDGYSCQELDESCFDPNCGA
jgi:hypothetical protein